MFDVEVGEDRCPRCQKLLPEVGYAGSYDLYCDGSCSSAGTPAASEADGAAVAQRLSDDCTKGENTFAAMALLKLGDALRRRDAAAWRRISWNVGRRLEGESPAYLVAAAYDVHLGRAAAVVNSESDLAHWPSRHPHSKACGACDAPAGSGCRWEKP
jgi:hypothetical protein